LLKKLSEDVALPQCHDAWVLPTCGGGISRPVGAARSGRGTILAAVLDNAAILKSLKV